MVVLVGGGWRVVSGGWWMAVGQGLRMSDTWFSLSLAMSEIMYIKTRHGATDSTIMRALPAPEPRANGD